MRCSIEQIFILLTTLKSMANSCECERHNTKNHLLKAKIGIGKRDLEFDNNTSTVVYNTSETAMNATSSRTLNISGVLINDDEVKNKRKDINEVCPQYKIISDIDMDKMADVWQTAYFRMSERVSCFKIYIRKSSEKERRRLAEKYGDFNNRVDWDKCLLEIRSEERQYTFKRKHYLQGTGTANGILANVILEENENRGNVTYIHEENADQWLVINNLLLMRDCENGDVVVFSRVPHQPRLEDMWDALKAFGEEAMNGTLACLEDDRVQRSIKNVLQEVLFRFRLL